MKLSFPWQMKNRFMLHFYSCCGNYGMLSCFFFSPLFIPHLTDMRKHISIEGNSRKWSRHSCIHYRTVEFWEITLWTVRVHYNKSFCLFLKYYLHHTDCGVPTLGWAHVLYHARVGVLHPSDTVRYLFWCLLCVHTLHIYIHITQSVLSLMGKTFFFPWS